MKGKDKLTPLLNCFKKDHVDLDYTVNYIVDIYNQAQSKWFFRGVWVGAAVSSILHYILSK